MQTSTGTSRTRWLFAALIGGGGLLILLWLGTWQMQRLAWKQTLLADIDARISAAPVALPDTPDPQADRYLPVTVTGRFDPDTSTKMLASRKTTGAVHRILAPFTLSDNRRIMVDVGWITADKPMPALPLDPVTLTGNLDWPRETDSFTPPHDAKLNLWYARDIAPLATAFETQDILLVLREKPKSDIPVTPWPVDSGGIPNDHLQYAITWFSLAVIWVGMTLIFVLRTPRSRNSQV